MSSIYLVGSLRNPKVPEIAKTLRLDGHDVFDDWHGSGPEADDHWRSYEIARGRPYEDAIVGKAPQNIMAFDKANIDASDIVILVLPAGRSAHMEAGYAIGAGKEVNILLDKDYDRWDVMYAMVDGVWSDLEELRIDLIAGDIKAQKIDWEKEFQQFDAREAEGQVDAATQTRLDFPADKDVVWALHSGRFPASERHWALDIYECFLHHDYTPADAIQQTLAAYDL